MSIIALTTLAVLGGITGLLVVMNLLIPFVIDAGGDPGCWGTGVGVGASFAALIAAFPITGTYRSMRKFYFASDRRCFYTWNK